MLTQLPALAALVFSFTAVCTDTPNSYSGPSVPPSSGTSQIAITEARHTRKVFYVGGQYNKTASGTILENSIYVEQLTPAGGVSQPKPLVLIHGGNLAGDLWLNKPDGGRGWASFFLDRGYQVYILDAWSVGRSGPQPPPSPSGGFTLEGAQQAFTAPERYNKYYQAKFHTQWPGVSIHMVHYARASFGEKAETNLYLDRTARLVIPPSMTFTPDLAPSTSVRKLRLL